MSRTGGAGLWRIVLTALIVSRVIWLGVTVLVLHVDFPSLAVWPGLHSALVQWDAISYLHISHDWYPINPDGPTAYLDAFLPGYPLMLRAGQLVMRDDTLAAWLITLGSEALGLWFVARLVLAERDRAAAAFAVWLLALAPTALFLIAPFTESPFIAAAAATLYYSRAGRVRAAAIAGAAAVALRLTGLALLPALLLDALMRERWRPRRHMAWLALVPLPLLLYCAYMKLHTGEAFVLFHANASASFGHSAAWPWDGFSTTWNTLVTATDGETRSVFAREVAFGLLGLVASVAMWVSSRTPRSLALYTTLAWLITASLSFWRSEPRYILALFPALILLADATARARRARYVLVAASGVLMAAGCWVFAEGRWLG